MAVKEKKRLHWVSGSGRIATPKPLPKKRPRREAPRQESEEIVYTQPKPFNRGKFCLRLATAAAVVLAVVFGLSIFFKVDRIYVSGCDRYTPWEIREASGIREGENLMGVNKAQVGGNIISKLPHVGSVRVRINLPDTVIIEVSELQIEELYAFQDQDGFWWMVTASGRVVQAGAEAGCPQIQGVRISHPEVGAEVRAHATMSEGTGEGEAPVENSNAQNLQAALDVARALESQRVSGKIRVVDVTDPANIEAWYGTQYQILLGDTSRLEYKVHAAALAAAQLTDYQSGTLDASFTQWPTQVGYTPFPEGN